jgi:hypothetical protein
MVTSRLAALLTVAALPVLACCPGKGAKRAYPDPTVDDLLAYLETKRAAVSSFKADSQMDYWVGDDRFRGTVWVMGKLGSYARLNALKPDDSVAADLACDGTNFVYIDQLNNCELQGPCDEHSIAQLLRVPLEPDEFLYLALGATPVIDGAQGTVKWDSKRAREVIELTGSGGLQQTIELDGRGKSWNLLRSEMRAADGTVIWTADHTDYGAVKDAAGKDVMVPGKSNFKTPAEKSDLLVEWGERRTVNPELPDEAWILEPSGAPVCGQKKP